MPKILIVKVEVPSRSRVANLLIWMNNLLQPHNMKVVDITEEVIPEVKRFSDGREKPWLSPEKYDELRNDDRFLYNRRDK